MNPMTLVLVGIYGISVFVFTLIALATWLRHRKLNKNFTRYGLVAASGIIITEVLALLTLPEGIGSSLPIIIIIDCIAFFRLLAFTAAGMYCCAKLGIVPFRLIARRQWAFESQSPTPVTETLLAENSVAPVEPEEALVAEKFSTETESVEPAPEIEEALEVEAPLTETEPTEVAAPPTPEDIEASPIPSEQVPEKVSMAPYPPVQSLPTEVVVERPLPPLPQWQYWLATLGAAAFACLYSVLLFLLTKPTIATQLQTLVEGSGDAEVSMVNMVVVVIAFAYAEEIMFRLGIQNMLAYALRNTNRNYWIAIAISSLIWTFGHSGTLDPDWVKLLQIFPIGLVFGWLFRRYGTESAIIAHVVFNVILGVFGQSLILN